MAAEGDAICKLCRLAEGMCAVGFRKRHERSDPQCRLHGVTGQASGAMPARPHPKAPAATGDATTASSTLHNEQDEDPPATQRERAVQNQKGAPMVGSASGEKVLFVTRRGLHLQFDADPKLDQWVNSEIKLNNQTGDYVKPTGEALNKGEKASYKKYQRRHRDRCLLGDAADKLCRITDRYMPRMADENRVFIMKFPEQAPQLLRRARKIRRGIKAQRKNDQKGTPETPSNTGEGKQRGTKAASRTQQRAGGSSKRSKRVAKEGTTCVPAGLPKTGETKEQCQGEQADDGEESVPDWGDDASGGSAEATEAQDSADTTAATGDTQSLWPWGKEGRPSERGGSTGVLSQRPSEPATSPKKKGAPGGDQSLQSAVHLVQMHMARRRAQHGLQQQGTE